MASISRRRCSSSSCSLRSRSSIARYSCGARVREVSVVRALDSMGPRSQMHASEGLNRKEIYA